MMFSPIVIHWRSVVLSPNKLQWINTIPPIVLTVKNSHPMDVGFIPSPDKLQYTDVIQAALFTTALTAAIIKH